MRLVKPSVSLIEGSRSSERFYPLRNKSMQRTSLLWRMNQYRALATADVGSKKGKDDKRQKGPKILPPVNSNDWRRRVTEVPKTDEYQSLSPWLRQLWKGDGKSTSGIVEPSTIGTQLKLKRSLESSDSSKTGEKLLPTDNDVDDEDDNSATSELSEVYEGKANLESMQPSDSDYSDKLNVFDRVTVDPKLAWPVDPNLYPHVRACLGDIEFESREVSMRETGLHVCTLGTSAGNACRLRSNTCTVVKAGSVTYLFDAGEGVQRQFMLSRLGFNEVRKIFITHMHADHVYGLPGLLLSLQVARMYSRAQLPVEIYGPVGLYNFLAMTLALTGTQLRRLNVHVYELQGGTQRSMRFAGNRQTYPEFAHKVSDLGINVDCINVPLTCSTIACCSL
jgi:Metallo-beta-lactamase superfamily